MRSRKLSAERLAKLRDHMAKVNSRGRSEEHKAKNSAFLAKFNVSNKGFKVVVTNLETNVSVEYAPISDTARVLNSNKTTIQRYIQNSKPFLGIYQLETKLPVSKKGNSNRKNPSRAIKIEVTDLELNTKTTYDSMDAAAIALKIDKRAISNYLKRGAPPGFAY